MIRAALSSALRGLAGMLAACCVPAAPAAGDAPCAPLPVVGKPLSTAVVDHRITLQFTDGSGTPVAARVSVFDGAGAPLPPEDGSIPFYWAWTGHKYFYAADTVAVGVPAGTVRVRAARGPECRTFDQTFTVGADTVVVVPLPRAFDARTAGWWSGDTHVHINHGGAGSVYSVTPEDYRVMARAEDLHVSCLLTNGLFYQGPGPHPAGDAEHLLHMAAEYRSALYGHLDILGTSVLPPSTGCCLPGQPAAPLNADIVDWTRAHGGLAIVAHPFTTPESDFTVDSAAWPYSGLARELPATATLSGIDGFDILSYSGWDGVATRGLYFDLLNLRHRVPLSAGTDATADRDFSPPPGGFRVYVRCDSLGLDDWLEGLRAGRSFATNGPLLLDFTVQGARSGDVLERSSGQSQLVSGSVKILSREPVTYFDIYADGILRRRFILLAFADSLDLAFSFILPPTAGWIVGRAGGPAANPATLGTELVAYTSPVWVRVDGSFPPPVSTAVSRFEGWIADLQDMVLARTGWIGEQQKIGIWLRLEQARWHLLYGEAALSVPDAAPPGAPRVRVGPNPFRPASGVARITVAPTAPGPFSVRVYDLRGRVVRTLRDGDSPGGPLVLGWDGRGDDGAVVADGIYFLRAAGGGVAPAVARLVVLGR